LLAIYSDVIAEVFSRTFFSSDSNLSPKPLSNVLPPLKTMDCSNVERLRRWKINETCRTHQHQACAEYYISRSHFDTERMMTSGTPAGEGLDEGGINMHARAAPLSSDPMMDGQNKTSAARLRSDPNVNTLPSGNLYVTFGAVARWAASMRGRGSTSQTFSFISRTISRSADVVRATPLRRSSSWSWSVTSEPPMSLRVMALVTAKPSYTGTAVVQPSPQSRTKPVVRPAAYMRENVGSSRIKHRTNASVQRENGLHRKTNGWDAEGFKHDLGSSFPLDKRMSKWRHSREHTQRVNANSLVQKTPEATPWIKLAARQAALWDLGIPGPKLSACRPNLE
jgi:hypothetical protein